MLNRSGWQYAAAGLFIASIAAVISYNDGLFVARLAGNHDRLAYLIPLLPDGLIVICLLALVEGARMNPPQRSAWAMAGLVLGVALTLAMNAGAGAAHGPLDAIVLGMVPVVFFIAVEVVLWHVRRGQPERQINRDFSSAPGTVPSSAYEAAKARMRDASARGFKYSDNEAAQEWKLTRSLVTKARREVAEESPAVGSPTFTPAGASGREESPLLPATLNGNGRHA